MTMEPSKLAEVLRRIADAIEPLDAKALDAFLKGLGSSRTAKSNPRRMVRPTASIVDRKALLSVLKDLQTAPSRSAGVDILAKLKLNRTELVTLAKAGNVHVTKEDTVARLEEKLVETLIGSRLNSQAIRGLSPD